ncbi:MULTISPECIES: DUF6029 family protein [Mesonia]|uniref:Uncharacterized protein n=1 Tax=Mesonia oceanica TaxID=2687242 RepID=A0AC61Y6G5_9FLAO|nr:MULTISPECIES: DUF6029 family protein [Mesonia]MAN26087.1 hypothetical protein [Mesonia sp.]MAQ42220.1 hypothetical protein [Mesonia sp.]MBJ97912.1 hypothetical protein [Flavobacteriaceae bacterium]VVV00079.1 hypothetical protein FVB9532_01344 [Mesonia oceanica]|tara:strand:+ start:36489 stop:38144 length:1656 start_codon:yes stop_codon:yes gene_type:complete
MKSLRTLISLAFISLGVQAFAQDLGNFYGGFESNSQWLQDDQDLGFTAPKDQFRSNNYFLLNYEQGKFKAGLQYESYLPRPMLGYDPVLEGNQIANYYVNFTDKSLDITAGYFYEQFGSGLILRAWENRQLGINTALKGVRVKYDFTDFWNVTGVYGEQRVGFETSDGVIQGVDTSLDLGQLLSVKDLFVDLGGSYVSRYQDNNGIAKIPTTVNAYAGRVDLFYKNFYANFEGVYKEPDVLANEGQITNNANLYKGNALLLTLGYAKSGLGISSTLRRLENFSFFADRLAEGNQFNRQRINYVPALTKQHDYLLSNIYVYNPQPRLLMLDTQQAGEMGGQLDIYYTIKKETALGGKYGTKLSANFAYWGGLDAEFDVDTDSYSSKFIGSGGPRYFREATLEIKKRWNKELSGIYYYTNTRIDKGITDGSPLGVKDIKANIAVAEHTYRLGNGKSVRLELQHLWTEQDRKNWAASVLEYNFSSSFGLYAADSWNYGGEGEIHYYNVGGSYTQGRTRVALNYGRQRGGLICVGGVCRFVPENTGLTLNLTTSF